MKAQKVSAAVLAAGCFLINSAVQATAAEDKKVVSNKPAATVKVSNTVSKSKFKMHLAKQEAKTSNEKKKVKTEKFRGMELPADYKKILINGDAVATKGQAVNLIKQTNKDVKLECSVEEIVDLYWVEAQREGVRPDLALCQALVETGFFRYGGNVKPKQNNFCGLGTTGKGVRGAKFKTPEIGVRAHIQHLLAYTHKNKPSTKIVDPRYELAHKIRLERGIIDTWYGLNGTWAMGSHYCEKIMAIYQNMLGMEMSEEEKAAKLELEKKLEQEQKLDKKALKRAKKEAEKREKERLKAERREKKRLAEEEKRRKKEERKMRERVDKILHEEKHVEVEEE